ncbi:hypothetical protein JC221_113 [Yersinia phage JC221]|nr:hypothetical protein JC221_113 [Yersinia phage JC221]
MISKTTINFAKKRGIFFDVCEADEIVECDRLWFFFEEDACEPDLSYIMNADGSFTYFDTLTLSNEVKEELPATIRDEKHLREVVAFLANEIKGE